MFDYKRYNENELAHIVDAKNEEEAIAINRATKTIISLRNELAAYRATGLSSEQVREIDKADQHIARLEKQVEQLQQKNQNQIKIIARKSEQYNTFENKHEELLQYRDRQDVYIEQLQAQNGTIREALARAREVLHQISIIYPGINVAWETLEQIDKAIGGEKNA